MYNATNVNTAGKFFFRDCSLEGIPYFLPLEAKKGKFTARDSEFFFYLAYLFSKKQKECLWILRDDLARHLKCTVRTVTRIIHTFSELGIVTVQRKTTSNPDGTFKTFNHFSINWIEAFKAFGNLICGAVREKIRDYVMSKLSKAFALCGTLCPASTHNSFQEYINKSYNGEYKNYLSQEEKTMTDSSHNTPSIQQQLHVQSEKDCAMSPDREKLREATTIKTYGGTYIDQEIDLEDAQIPSMWGEIAVKMGIKKECVRDVFDDFVFYWVNQGKIKKAKKRDWYATWKNNIRMILGSKFTDYKEVEPEFRVYHGEKNIYKIWKDECVRRYISVDTKELSYFVRVHDRSFPKITDSYKGWEERVKAWLDQKEERDRMAKKKIVLNNDETSIYRENEKRKPLTDFDKRIVSYLDLHYRKGSGEDLFYSWFGQCEITVGEGGVIVKAPNPFVRERIKNEYRNVVEHLKMTVI